MNLQLVTPSVALVPSFLEALSEGNFIGMQLGHGDLPASVIEKDAQAYIDLVTDRKPFSYELGGKMYEIRAHELLWITDGTRFLGTVALRFEGDREIMEEFAGHIGMAVRPALLNKGYGPRAIQKTLNIIAEKFIKRGLSHIFATCDLENSASSRLIQHFGGELVEKYDDLYGFGPSLRYIVKLDKI